MPRHESAGVLRKRNYFLVELFVVELRFATEELFVRPNGDPALDNFRVDDPCRDKSDFSVLSFVPEDLTDFVEDFFVSKDFNSCSADFILSIVVFIFSSDFFTFADGLLLILLVFGILISGIASFDFFNVELDFFFRIIELFFFNSEFDKSDSLIFVFLV